MRKTNFSCSEPTRNSDFGLNPRSKSATRSSKVSGRSLQSVSVIKSPTRGLGGRPPTRQRPRPSCRELRRNIWALARRSSSPPQVAERRLPEGQGGDGGGVGPQDTGAERHRNDSRERPDRRPLLRRTA